MPEKSRKDEEEFNRLILNFAESTTHLSIQNLRNFTQSAKKSRENEDVFFFNFSTFSETIPEFTETKINATIHPEMKHSTLEPISIDYDDYGVGHRPSIADIQTGCEQFYAMGKYIPYEAVEFLTKVIYSVNTFDTVYFLQKNFFLIIIF